ncbi:hypothetical protein BGX24_012619 [Mortierella sp. AD032]|nr:hypothetical protein BGX24_012619 [Mortierella sp. AD032]
MLISTSIQGRLLVSPWPDDPAEDPVTGVPKGDHSMPLSRTEIAAKSSRNPATLNHYSPTAATGQLSVKDRISQIGSSTAPKPVESKQSSHISTVPDTNTQDKYRHQTAEAMSLDVSYQNSLSHPMSQVSSTESLSKRKERAHGITKRKVDTTATGTRSDGSYSLEPVVRIESGERGGNDEDQLLSSIDSVDQFNLETYQPPTKKPRRTAGQILAEIAGDSEAEVVSSSMPSVTSSAALAAGIEDIEGFLEKDLKGFTRLSY